MEPKQHRIKRRASGLPPRKLGWLCASIAAHACLISALIGFVRFPRPEHQWVLAYVLDPGAGEEAGRGASGGAAIGTQAWLVREPASPPERKRRMAEPSPIPSPAIVPISETPPRESLAMLDLGGATLRAPSMSPRGNRDGGAPGRGASSGSGAASGAGEGGGSGFGGGTLAHADYGASPLPAYPIAARRRGEQGTVTIRVLVGADGAVVRAEIARSSGFRELDDAALRTVRRRWRFVAARRDGRAVPSWVLVPIRFSLTEAAAQ